MGYLVDTSTTLPFVSVKEISTFIKQNGIIQFLHLYKKFYKTQQSQIFWGDEIEMHLVNIDPLTNQVKLQLNNEYIFDNFSPENTFSLQPECGAWMIETVPTKPYEFTGDPKIPLQNYLSRREVINSMCKEGDILFAGATFPTLKVQDYYIPKTKTQIKEDSIDSIETGDSSEEEQSTRSQIGYELLASHPRYAAICDTIKQRRGEDVCILIPIYKDINTSMEKSIEEPFPGYIYMDETIYGSANTSLQITFGTRNIEEARYLTDQMAILSSIVLPLSAASPIFKGKLAATDLRWTVLAGALDCRTPDERNPDDPKYVSAPRWSPMPQYISERKECKEEYNDIPVQVDKETMEFTRRQAQEMQMELDEKLIRHLGFLFNRDPLVVYSDKINVENTETTNHFENLQSTNWNNSRFKPPPSFDSEVGWRVELRTIEAQLTAMESTAFSMLAYFFAEMVTKKRYNFYIPISKLHENMQRAHTMDALLVEKFWFRVNVEPDSQDKWEEMTIDEILHGKKGGFIGLLKLIYKFCKEEYGVDMCEEWRMKLQDETSKISVVTENIKYFEILSKRARGEAPTIARWIRDFVGKHPKYQRDSMITPEIGGDLMKAMIEISDNKKTYSDFV